MATVLVVGNNKGGVGKTTVSIELSAALRNQKKRVLLIDMDPQCNSTTYSGAELDHANIKKLLDADAEPEDAIQKLPSFDIIGGSPALGTAETDYTGGERNFLLEDVIEEIGDKYDFIIIDLNTVYNNVLADMAYVAGNYLILPTNCDDAGVNAMEDVIGYTKRLKRNPIEPLAMVLVDFDKRMNISYDVWETMKLKKEELMPDGMIIKISTDANAKSARMQRMPIQEYDKKAKVLEDYTEFAKQVIAYTKKKR